MTDSRPVFEEDFQPVEPLDERERLMLALEGFEGPIDLLLNLARDQKVDLARISILQLANQYLDFIAQARELRLELAADYLVMASWLAYLKSRILIPEQKTAANEPSAEQMAEALAFQLRRLEAMRQSAQKIIALPRLGVDIFRRGAPEGLGISSRAVHEATLYDLLSAYGDIKERKEYAVYKLRDFSLTSIEEAIERLEKMLGKIPADWLTLTSFIPRQAYDDPLFYRSHLASAFGASLEMAKRGAIELRQEEQFQPIYLRKALANELANENEKTPGNAGAI